MSYRYEYGTETDIIWLLLKLVGWDEQTAYTEIKVDSDWVENIFDTFGKLNPNMQKKTVFDEYVRNMKEDANRVQYVYSVSNQTGKYEMGGTVKFTSFCAKSPTKGRT